MIGIILMSHGKMAEGMLNSCSLFFGKDIPQLKAICLMEGESPESFDERLKQALQEVDTGNGVIGFCDLFGGTPNNRCSLEIMATNNDRFQVISGMNFTMLLELLGLRMSDIDISEVDINELVETGRNGLLSLNQALSATSDSSNDDDFEF